MTALDDLLNRLDYSRCDCCSLCFTRCTAGVPMSRREFDIVRMYAQREAPVACDGAMRPRNPVIPIADGLAAEACRFLDIETRRCVVYPVRPLVCRMMGLVEWMPCPIGRAADPAPTAVALAAIEEYCMVERSDYETWLRLLEPAAADGDVA